MRLLFVVQRYGAEVAGGAEAHCREFASRLAARGHEVEVVTTCAVSYTDWANVYPAGTSAMDGVAVHRLPVAETREDRRFNPLNARVVWGRKPIPLYLQQEWMRTQGPYVPEMSPWIRARAAGFQVVIFVTYLYYTTWVGLPAAAGLVPTVLHPTAHDEPPIYLPLFDTTFRLPTAFAFLTQEEADLVRRRFRIDPISSVVGIGVDPVPEGDEKAFRETYGLGDRPYLVFVGRVDPAKGSDELLDFFATYKERNPGPLTLVLVGEPVKPPAAHPDVILTGFVDEATKHSALSGALALAHPSYFESFSMVLTEAWAHSKPALVQGHCKVLEGQVRRSGGGIPYRGFGEFEEGLNMLLGEPGIVASLGHAGRKYAEEKYNWARVLDRYEDFLVSVGD